MTLELILVGVRRRSGAGVIRDGLWRSGEAGIVIFIIRREHGPGHKRLLLLR